MLNGIAAAEAPREAWLLYGVRDGRDHIMRTHLEALAGTHANLRLHVFYSRPARAMARPIRRSAISTSPRCGG